MCGYIVGLQAKINNKIRQAGLLQPPPASSPGAGNSSRPAHTLYRYVHSNNKKQTNRSIEER